MMPSAQTAGVYNLSAPVLGADGTCMAALTCPLYRIGQRARAPDITRTIAHLQNRQAALYPGRIRRDREIAAVFINERT